MAQIKTYARLKPTKKPYSGYEINKNVLTVHIPDSKDFLVVSSQQAARSNLSYDIMFTDIFRPEATQEDVFDGVAKGIIQSFLNGYNGTIFAYGQTGTGKTYTVEGNATRYNTRGLSTRALSMIYQQLENRIDDHITVCLSYLEIYQEVAYDLLNPISRSSLPLAPFAKVTVVEGPRGSCIFRGLSLHLAANEEIAQMLLLQGQANRKVAETPVNQRSSRSHAVFTVYLQVRKHDSDVLLNSKLHLVDLAGSERVSKTGVDGQQLTEAKSINLSLHHLETVIIALQADRSCSSSSSGGGDKNRGDYPPSQSRSNTSFMSGPSSDSGTRPFKYVPYRNSLLTMVLKDSLGGNCLTAMIATISMEAENLGESISTCRFAQRVARIANNARRNEEMDDKTVIKRLKHKVANLEHQLANLRSKGNSDSMITDDDILSVLSDEDRTTCAKIMEGFMQGVIADPVDAGIYDQSRFRECLHLLKHQYLHTVSSNSQFLTAQPLPFQPRQVAADHSSEAAHHLQPNNPHRDSGDHIMSESTQADSSVFMSQHRSAVGTSSVTNNHATDEYFLVGEDQVVGAVSAGESEKKAVEKKSSEVDQVMETSVSEKCRPQYERHRSKECKKLNPKLTPLEQEQAVKQEQLAQISQDILMQELVAAENNLRLKLQVIEEQVVEQHAYLMQLRHNQADPVQFAREQLVEQHLLKRQAKFHDKLKKLLDNKTRLQCALSTNRDPNSLVYGACNRISLEDKFGQSKQGKGYPNWQIHDVESDQQKESSVKLDREKCTLKSMQPDVEESMTPEKIRELKQKHRMSQQQMGPMFGLNTRQCQSTPDKHQVEGSHSVDSNRSLRDSECHYSYMNSHLENSVATDKESKHDQEKTYPITASSRTGLHFKEKSFSEGSNKVDQQTKYGQEYASARFRDDSRLGKYSVPVKSVEAVKRPECGSSYILNNIVSPYQQVLNSSTLIQPEGIMNFPTQESEDVQIESPDLMEAKPSEVRSFHDPHHSHKFALDDMPAECSSLNNPKTGTIDSLNNTNNSYIHFTNSFANKYIHNINYNTNASSGSWVDFEIYKEKQHKTQNFEHQNQPHSAMDCGIVSSNCITSFATQGSTNYDSVKLMTKELKAGTLLDIQNQRIVGQIIDSNKPDVVLRSINNDSAETAAEHSNEELVESLNHFSILPSTAAHYKRRYKPTDASLPVIISGRNIKSVTNLGISYLLTQTFDSSISHMFELEKEANVDNILHEINTYKKFSLVSEPSSSQHISGVHPFLSPEINVDSKFGRRTDLSSCTKETVNTLSVWTPSLKNASSLRDQLGFFDYLVMW